MASTVYTEQAFRGGGLSKWSIEKPDGTWAGWVDVGNCDVFELTPKSSQINRPSRLPDESFGLNLDTDYTSEPTELKISFDNITGRNLAKALSATFSRNTGYDAGDVTDEVHVAWHDEQIRLSKPYVSSVVMSTISGGTGAAYTTDDVGYAIGDTLITVKAGTGTLVAGGAVTFDGDTTKYAIKTGFAGDGDGQIELMIGLKQAIPAAETDITVVAAVATLSSTTDYTADNLFPQYMKVLDTGVIPDGATVLVDYHYKKVEMDTLLGGLASFKARVELLGKNMKSGKWHSMYIGYLTCTSTTGFNFLTTEYAKGEISGVANIDPDVNSPSFGRPWILEYDKVPIS